MAKPSGAKPNYLYSIISVTLVLLLLGLFGLMVLQGQQLVKKMKEEVEIIVEMKEESGEEMCEGIEWIFWQKVLFTKQGSAEFISKDAWCQNDAGRIW